MEMEIHQAHLMARPWESGHSNRVVVLIMYMQAKDKLNSPKYQLLVGWINTINHCCLINNYQVGQH